MNTTEENRCKRCGAIVPATSTEKLCPACLMAGAVEPVGSLAFGDLATRYEPDRFPYDFGGYRLLGLLGRGGMGTVYEAEQIATGRRVALKMLAQELDSPDMRQRFLREGRLAAGVSHPNSLYIFGSEEIEGVPVITMEIAGRGTLRDRLKKGISLPVPEAVDAILDVIAGLEAAFTAGVLHRDIKPANCFTSPDGSVKIGDFGLSVSTLARENTYVTETGVIMGTPAYASPEQLRGDDLDVRADIYSVGATLFTLLTGVAPFEGENAVQVVANTMSEKPKLVTELRAEVPPALAQVVDRCLAKEPGERYADYATLRNDLLPFSSREPEPASMKVRAAAGWIDYLIAFLVPYVILMLTIGNEAFHFRFLMERTLYSARHYIAFLSFGFLYFTLAEGIWGAGFGKRFKGLRVIRRDGRPPGIGRAFLRIVIPILCVEGVRIPILLATISATQINELTVSEIVIYSVATSVCPWIPVLLSILARAENGYATIWDLASGTRVVVKPEGAVRQAIELGTQPDPSLAGTDFLGPYQLISEIDGRQQILATDPVLRRQVWLLKRSSSEPTPARRNLGRPGRLRWLQKVETAEATWDAFEAVRGVPFSALTESGKRVPWGTLRHWLHDLASELWDAGRDQTLPAEVSLDHVWITAQGKAILLDEPWPDVKTPAEAIPVGDISGQQRFLNAVAACVDTTSLPLHARPVLQNLAAGTFEKLSFLTGTLRGLLDKPADVTKGIRAGSIFMLPLYIGIMIFVGAYQGADWLNEIIGDSLGAFALATIILVLAGSALIQILELPLRTFCSYAIFRLAVINAKGEPSNIPRLLLRWGIVWLPLSLPIILAAQSFKTGNAVALTSALVLLLLWIGAAVYAIIHPNRGLHDRLAGTWVVRR